MTPKQRRLIVEGAVIADRLRDAGGRLSALTQREVRTLLDCLAVREELGLGTSFNGCNFTR